MRSDFKQDASGYWMPVSPSAILDYAEDWETWLNGDTIQTVVWIVAAELTSSNPSNTDSIATIWLSGFVINNVYEIGCTVTTVAGRTDTRYFRLVCGKR